MDEQTPETPETTEELQVDAPVEETNFTDDAVEQDSFGRDYVQALRRESASYRTKAKDFEPFAKAFEGYSDDDRTVWQEAMRLVSEDPKAGGAYLEQIAKALLAEEQAAVEAPPAEGDDVPLTRAEYAQMREAEKVQAAQEAEVARIESEAKELGYDSASDEYTYLLTVASRLPSGSLQEAHAKIEAAYQAKIDAYLAAKAADADGAGAPPADAGDAPSGERQIRNFQDARRAALARVEASKIHG
jgi:hypothetical protein